MRKGNACEIDLARPAQGPSYGIRLVIRSPGTTKDGNDARAIHPTLRVTPNPIPLGRPLTVTVVGIHPGETIAFQVAPVPLAGFGGGLMGRYRAGPAGAIHFTYPPFRQTWEVSVWRVSASRPGGGVVASIQVRVTAGTSG